MIELEKQSRRRKIIRGLITFLLLFALVGGGFYLGYRYLEDSQQRQVELEKKKVNSEKQKVKTEYRKMVLENSEVLVAKETLDQTNQNENSGHDFAVADANYRQIFKNKTDLFADKIRQENLLNENTREIVNGYVNQANKKLTQATKYLRETKEDLDSSASETSSTAETDNNLDLSQRQLDLIIMDYTNKQIAKMLNQQPFGLGGGWTITIVPTKQTNYMQLLVKVGSGESYFVYYQTSKNMVYGTWVYGSNKQEFSINLEDWVSNNEADMLDSKYHGVVYQN